MALHLDTKEVQDSILTWLQYKKEKGQAYKPTGLKGLFTKLGKDYKTGPELVSAIEGSISKNYAGIFPCKQYEQNNRPNKMEIAMAKNFDLIKQFEGQ